MLLVAATTAAPASYVNNAAQKPQPSDSGRSLSDEFHRMIAAKENGTVAEEDDAPMWDSVRNPPQVENVLAMIPGTVVQ